MRLQQSLYYIPADVATTAPHEAATMQLQEPLPATRSTASALAEALRRLETLF